MFNQFLSVGLLQRVVRALSPPAETGLVAAFAYGSVAFPQHDRPSSDSQLDLIFIVRDPIRWHFDNVKYHPKHYNFLIRQSALASKPPFYFRTILSKSPGPQIYYNPFIHWYDEVEKKQLQLKYGVVSLAKALKDLQSWSHLYIAGRLHKPVLWIPLGDEQSSSKTNLIDPLDNSVSNNLLAALSYVLLQSTPGSRFISEFDLFRAITSISYDGDWRMLVGEDKNKVSRIVTGPERLSHFRKLYTPILNHPSLHKLVELLPTNAGGEANELHFYQPPESKDLVVSLLNNIPIEVCQQAIQSGYFGDEDPRQILAELPAEIRQLRLKRTIRRIVTRSSIQQTTFSLFSAGPIRSVIYASEKLRKMFASLGIIKW